MQTMNHKEFPFQFESTKKILLFPENETRFKGDVLEIGPGRGDVLFGLAKSNPTKRFVAIEIGKKRFYKLKERIPKRGLNNILLFGGNARIVLPFYFKEEGSFETIMVLFPDPWPKGRHAFRRLLSVEFITLLYFHLIKGGHLIMASDDKNYIDWVLENMTKISGFKNTMHPETFSQRIEELSESYFENKWKKLGRTNYFLKYEKI